MTGRTSRRRGLVAVALVLLAAVVVAACGDDSETATDAETTVPVAAGDGAATSTAAPDIDLAGVTLRIGDQINGLRSVFEASGEAADVPYTIEWSDFQGGPTVIAAQTGGSVDLGSMAETPVIFAQAAGSPVTVVAVSKVIDPTRSNLALIVKNDSPIRTVADLAGKKVLTNNGTVLQYLLVKALESEGLTTDDVELVNLQQGGSAAYDQGDVDVMGTGGAFLPITLAKGTDRVLVSGAGHVPGVNYLVARNGALEDPKLAAAIGDFVGRIARAQAWYVEHPAEAAKIAEGIFKVDASVAAEIVATAPARYVPINDEIIAKHQDEADVFVELGSLPKAIDATEVFDDRYNSIVEAAEVDEAVSGG